MVLTNVTSIHLGILLGNKLNYVRQLNEDYLMQQGMPNLSLSLHLYNSGTSWLVLLLKHYHILLEPNIFLNAYYTLVGTLHK